jgi:23S rRNA (cytidine1920-2'-O)/16S rRNA (cytidine1409-2'-O)-methyltransferase
MVRRGLVASRNQARRLIKEGKVSVSGVKAPKPSTWVDPSTALLLGEGQVYAGRAGHKLENALARFGLKVEGRLALDVGSGAGGFTDCLLAHGAARVVAIDVGHGQLDPRLLNHPRVECWERLDVRSAASLLGRRFDLVVVDLSFISLCAVAASLADLAAPNADLLLLVKPQFEVGKERIGKGIVHNPSDRDQAVEAVKVCLAEVGVETSMVIEAVPAGGGGNQEFFLWAVGR